MGSSSIIDRTAKIIFYAAVDKSKASSTQIKEKGEPKIAKTLLHYAYCATAC